MENGMPRLDPAVGRGLVLDELFDLTLYQRMRAYAGGDTRVMLEKLVAVEARHLDFWRKLFSLPNLELDFSRRVKLSLMVFFGRVFGEGGIHLLVEAIEVNGIREYLSLWEEHKDDAFGTAIEPILKDELGHEEVIVTSGTSRKIHPERIRDIFLGFNDGLVEVVGSASGFFAAFGTGSSVLIAGASVAVAGALSMAAGAYAAVGSASEIEAMEKKRRRFLGQADEARGEGSALMSGIVVGSSYFIGALVPLAPVFFGAENLVLPIIVSGIAAIAISYIVAFFSGMDPLRRIGINITAVALAIGVSYAIGILARAVWGVSL